MFITSKTSHIPPDHFENTFPDSGDLKTDLSGEKCFYKVKNKLRQFSKIISVNEDILDQF